MRLITLITAVLFLVGCTDTKYKLVPVHGKIAFSDGKTLPPGTKLLFRPFEGGMGGGSADLNPDGSFDGKHAKGMNGMEIGKYTVLLQGPKNDADFYKKISPVYYNDGLPVEIKEGMQPLDIKIKKK